MAIQKTQTSDKVWAFLTKAGFSNIGAAALMGNIYAESGMIANRVEILCLKRLKTFYGKCLRQLFKML